MTATIECYPGFGSCDTCGRYDGYLNIGRCQWFYCAEHKRTWIAGSNLFSSWRDQTVEEQEAIYNKIGIGGFVYQGPDPEGYARFIASRSN